MVPSIGKASSRTGKSPAFANSGNQRQAKKMSIRKTRWLGLFLLLKVFILILLMRVEDIQIYNE